MDIEQLKKINEMSKVLQSHGLADTSVEGTNIAGKMEETNVPSQEGPKKDMEQVEILLERQARKFGEAIKILSDRITELENKIESKQFERPQAETINIEEPKPAVQQQLPKEEKKDTSSLRADPDKFNDEEVSVEKMFYYGNK